MRFDDIHLTAGEKLSLLSFRFKKEQYEEEIKYFWSLAETYEFIARNYTGKADGNGYPIPTGTFSLTDKYIRFRIYRREKFFHSMPSWLAVVISIISLIVSVLK